MEMVFFKPLKRRWDEKRNDEDEEGRNGGADRGRENGKRTSKKMGKGNRREGTIRSMEKS